MVLFCGIFIKRVLSFGPLKASNMHQITFSQCPVLNCLLLLLSTSFLTLSANKRLLSDLCPSLSHLHLVDRFDAITHCIPLPFALIWLVIYKAIYLDQQAALATISSRSSVRLKALPNRQSGQLPQWVQCLLQLTLAQYNTHNFIHGSLNRNQYQYTVAGRKILAFSLSCTVYHCFLFSTRVCVCAFFSMCASTSKTKYPSSAVQVVCDKAVLSASKSAVIASVPHLWAPSLNSAKKLLEKPFARNWISLWNTERPGTNKD